MDHAIRSRIFDLVVLGRPALANPHWPVWAAREFAHNDPFHLVPDWYAGQEPFVDILRFVRH